MPLISSKIRLAHQSGITLRREERQLKLHTVILCEFDMIFCDVNCHSILVRGIHKDMSMASKKDYLSMTIARFFRHACSFSHYEGRLAQIDHAG